MSVLSQMTQALVDAVQQYEAKAQELQQLRNAVDQAHQAIAELLGATPQPVQQSQG